jgi:hypothetical protein
MLLGIVDETNSLQYGQVFIQLRDLNGETQIIHNQKILITKNPAHFPGDIRKLDAVDCPALHHLYECVVFPAQGERPHPNEISGSDLDGDEVGDSSLFFLLFFISYLLSIGYVGMRILSTMLQNNMILLNSIQLEKRNIMVKLQCTISRIFCSNI